jgi:hypothetical protein
MRRKTLQYISISKEFRFISNLRLTNEITFDILSSSAEPHPGGNYGKNTAHHGGNAA